MKTVIEIVKEYLEENKFDGLYSPNMECGCCLKDLAPCGNIEETCTAGYKHKYRIEHREGWLIVPTPDKGETPNE